MSVITKELAHDFIVPTKCEQCDRKAEILRQHFVRANPSEGVNPPHGIIWMGYCKYHAIDLIYGMMRDVRELHERRRRRVKL